MLTVSLSGDYLKIKAHYFYKDRIKQLPTATFNPNDKTWMIEKRFILTMERDFPGEIFYKTPRWVILEEPAPDMSQMYKIDSLIDVPAMKLTPFDYQQYGIKFMIDKILQHGFVINSDSVGLGKTPQAIGTMKWFIENHNANKILIICKKSIKAQWQSEISKFTDVEQQGFVIERTYDTKKKREKAYESINNNQKGILITNYHNFLNDTDLINNLNFDFIIIDEVHCIATRTGVIHKNIAKVCKGITSAFLTGTPVMSKPEDIFGIVQLSNPRYFGAWKNFSKKYIVEDYNGMYTSVVGAKNLDELRDLVQNIIIRRTEHEVSVQLPEVVITKIDCEKDTTQDKIMKTISDMRMELTSKYTDLMDVFKKTNNPTALEQATQIEAQMKGLIAATQAAATDPRMFLMTHSKMMQKNFGSLVPSSYKMSNKIEAILDLIEEILLEDEKVILFSKFRTSVTLIAQDIKAKFKVNTLLYTGQEDDDARDFAIQSFLNSDNYNILIGTEAMAEGLNLQKAKYIINIDQPDTLAIKTQRIGRIRRVGSAFSGVVVYDMITQESKDTERLENIERNEDLEGALINIDDAQRQALLNAMKK